MSRISQTLMVERDRSLLEICLVTRTGIPLKAWLSRGSLTFLLGRNPSCASDVEVPRVLSQKPSKMAGISQQKAAPVPVPEKKSRKKVQVNPGQLSKPKAGGKSSFLMVPHPLIFIFPGLLKFLLTGFWFLKEDSFHPQMNFNPRVKPTKAPSKPIFLGADDDDNYAGGDNPGADDPWGLAGWSSKAKTQQNPGKGLASQPADSDPEEDELPYEDPEDFIEGQPDGLEEGGNGNARSIYPDYFDDLDDDEGRRPLGAPFTWHLISLSVSISTAF